MLWDWIFKSSVDGFGSNALLCPPVGSCRTVMLLSAQGQWLHSRICLLQTVVCSPDCLSLQTHVKGGELPVSLGKSPFLLISSTLLVCRDRLLSGSAFLCKWMRMLCPWFEDHAGASTAPSNFPPWIYSVLKLIASTSHRSKRERRECKEGISF